MTSLKHIKGRDDWGEGGVGEGQGTYTRTITGVTCQFAGLCLLCTRQQRESEQTYIISLFIFMTSIDFVLEYYFSFVL